MVLNDVHYVKKNMILVYDNEVGSKPLSDEVLSVYGECEVEEIHVMAAYVYVILKKE